MYIEESINIYWRVSKCNSPGQFAVALEYAIFGVDILTKSNTSK